MCAAQTTLPYEINVNPQPSYVTIEVQDPVICTGETTALGLSISYWKYPMGDVDRQREL